MTTDAPGQSATLFDANVLVALAMQSHVHHRAAHRELTEGRDQWATTPLTEAALVRLLLNPQVTGRPIPAVDVLGMLATMREHARWVFLPDDTSLATAGLELRVLVGHQQVTDLHLVNLAARHQAVLGTFDARLVASLAPSDRRYVRVLPT